MLSPSTRGHVGWLATRSGYTRGLPGAPLILPPDAASAAFSKGFPILRIQGGITPI